MWTRFMDMNSGGGRKEPYDRIYIEAPKDEAEIIFYNRFGHNPHRVSCTCCGSDYSIDEHADLAQATAFERNCDHAWFDPQGNEVEESEAWVRGKGTKEGYSSRYVERQDKRRAGIRASCNTDEADPWGKYKTLEEYKKSDKVLFIYAHEIKAEERKGTVPEQGYVWKD